MDIAKQFDLLKYWCENILPYNLGAKYKCTVRITNTNPMYLSKDRAFLFFGWGGNNDIGNIGSEYF